MKLSIKTKDIELEYEDEYADLGKDVKERIEDLIKTVYQYQSLSIPVGIVEGTTNSKTEITMAQQTAVEWLFKLSKERELDKFDLEQAKQMEKEQIMQSYNDGKSAVIHIEENKSLEQYYNETYGAK